MPHPFAAQVRQITPFMHVPAIEPALRFLTDIIGFEVVYSEAGYAYLELGPAALRVLESEEDSPPPPNGGFRYYLDVDDVDAVHSALKEKLATLPAGDVFGPVDQPWRQRELLIRAPDGGLPVFGAPIKG